MTLREVLDTLLRRSSHADDGEPSDRYISISDAEEESYSSRYPSQQDERPL